MRNYKKKYDYTKIQQLIDEGNSYNSLRKLLGISSRTLSNAQHKGWIKFPENNYKRLLDIGIIKRPPCKEENKEKFSKMMSDRIKKNIRYSNMEEYNGVWLDSSYESILARNLDKNNIKWTRPSSLKWNDNGQIRRYVPDFYLPDYDVYLDPKNDFLIKKDQRKIALASLYNKVSIIILSKNELSWAVVLEKIKNNTSVV
jgi:hypothetical protein